MMKDQAGVLQRLLDDRTVEGIEIIGSDRVVAIRTGSTSEDDPIAANDEDMLAIIRALQVCDGNPLFDLGIRRHPVNEAGGTNDRR